VIKGKSYTFFIASTPGKLRKLVVPAYALHGLAVLALIGMITVTAAVGSYSRMLWKVGNYNALRHEQESLKVQYHQLQTTVNDTNQRLDSLQSLATEVAMTYGVLRYHPAAFDVSDNPVTAQDAFDRSVEQYTFLKKNAAARKSFEGFPPSAQRDYVEWIVEAKREETRAKRLAQAVEWMAEGKRRNWKYENC